MHLMISSQKLDFLNIKKKKIINLNKRVQKNIVMEIHIINEKESFPLMMFLVKTMQLCIRYANQLSQVKY